LDYRKLQIDKSKGKTVTDYEKIPDQRGGYKPLIQPGDALFRLPKNLAEAWVEPFMADVGGTKDERVAVQFDDDHPLTIVKAHPALLTINPEAVGATLRFRISNAERNRAKKGEPQALVSDMYYLVFESFASEVNGSKPKDNLEWMALMSSLAGKEFVGAITWSTYCSKEKVRYLASEESESGVIDPEGVKGCGARYYSKDIPKEGGLLVERFVCGGKRAIEGGVEECIASLRCYANVERFRAASTAAGW
jgi:hypothetical protein